jgi:hypothetical protein
MPAENIRFQTAGFRGQDTAPELSPCIQPAEKYSLRMTVRYVMLQSSTVHKVI